MQICAYFLFYSETVLHLKLHNKYMVTHLSCSEVFALIFIYQSVRPFIRGAGSGLVLSRVQNMTEHLPSLLTGVTLIMVPSSTIWCHSH